jgi:hypothetical protein
MNLGPPPFERIRCNVGSDKPSQVESSFSVSNRLPILIGPSHHRGPGALVVGFEGYLVITFIQMRRGEINRLQLYRTGTGRRRTESDTDGGRGGRA